MPFEDARRRHPAGVPDQRPRGGRRRSVRAARLQPAACRAARRRAARLDHRAADLRHRAAGCRSARRCPTPSTSRTAELVVALRQRGAGRHPARRRPRPATASSWATSRSATSRIDIPDGRWSLPGRLRFHLHQGLHPARVGGHRPLPEPGRRHLGAAGDRPADRRAAAGRHARPAGAERRLRQGRGLRLLHGRGAFAGRGQGHAATPENQIPTASSRPAPRAVRHAGARGHAGAGAARRRASRRAPRSSVGAHRRHATATGSTGPPATAPAHGSGFKHVTLYVADDGGDFKIWQRQLERRQRPDSSSRARPAHLRVPGAGHRPGRQPREAGARRQRAGRRRQCQPRRAAAGAGHHAAQLRPAAAAGRPAVHQRAVQRGRGAGSRTSTPLTRVERVRHGAAALRRAALRRRHRPEPRRHRPDGDRRGARRLDPGLRRRQPRRHLPLRRATAARPTQCPGRRWTIPIFNLAFDAEGRLWATTGGGPLLQLDPDTGGIVERYGDGITIALAVEPERGRIFVSTNSGVSVFDPDSGTFTQFSRDENLRVGSLAFDNQGNLWAVTWPDRTQVVRFTARAPRRAACWSSIPTSTRSPSASPAATSRTCCSSRTTPAASIPPAPPRPRAS